MRKLLVLFAALFVSTQAFATYFVVLKDGSQIRARAKWTVVNGKAIVPLETGGTMALDPKSIDVEKSEQVTANGGGSVLAVEQTPNTPAPQQSSLGGAFKLRKLPNEMQPTQAQTSTAPVTPKGPVLSRDVVDRFEKAYENVGVFEHTLTPMGPHALRAELVTDNEERVFNVLSATAFLMVRNAGIPGTQIDTVELFLKTTMGGSAGRFLMSQADAATLDNKSLSAQEFFVRKVLY